MANKDLFRNSQQKAANTLNNTGGKAYQLSDKEALAQYAVTGCLNGTFYTDAKSQLDAVLDLCKKVNDEFVADLAVYARQHAFMKDMPCLLLAYLSTRNTELLKKAFPKVIDNGNMARTFVQIMRSGQVGRNSLGSAPKKLVADWIRDQNAQTLFKASVGNSPSLSDVIKMVRPKPVSAEQDAMFGYLLGKDLDKNKQSILPGVVKDYEAYKAGQSTVLPRADFRQLTSLSLSADDWKGIARRAPWMMTRMNLNTFARNGVFEDRELTQVIADRIKNPELIRKAKAFPYQLMMSYMASNTGVPETVTDALQEAMTVALENVPSMAGKVYVLVDVSGSMTWPVTGYRQGATSAVRCIDVAALFAAALKKTCQDVTVLGFDTQVYKPRINRQDSVMTIANQLSRYGGGGTSCGAPFAELNREKAQGDLILVISDNESWADNGHYYSNTKMAQEWDVFKRRNRQAKLVCWDIAPNQTTQAMSGKDVLNIGGFSDQVFKAIDYFNRGGGNAHFFSEMIRQQVA